MTIGVLTLCLAGGHMLLPAVSVLTRRRRIKYRLTRTGAILDGALVLAGVLLIVLGVTG